MFRSTCENFDGLYSYLFSDCILAVSWRKCWEYCLVVLCLVLIYYVSKKCRFSGSSQLTSPPSLHLKPPREKEKTIIIIIIILHAWLYKFCWIAGWDNFVEEEKYDDVNSRELLYIMSLWEGVDKNTWLQGWNFGKPRILWTWVFPHPRPPFLFQLLCSIFKISFGCLTSIIKSFLSIRVIFRYKSWIAFLSSLQQWTSCNCINGCNKEVSWLSKRHCKDLTIIILLC